MGKVVFFHLPWYTGNRKSRKDVPNMNLPECNVQVNKDKALDILTIAAAVSAVVLAVAAVFNLLYQILSALKEIRRTMPVVRRAAEIYIDERTPEEDDFSFDPEDLLAEEEEDEIALEEEMLRSMQDELEEAKYL